MAIVRPRTDILGFRDVGGGVDADTHLCRILITEPYSDVVLLDKMMTDEAAYALGMMLARASCPKGTALFEVDVGKAMDKAVKILLAKES